MALVEEDAVQTAIDRVKCIHRNRCQAAAATKRLTLDADDAIGDRDAGQAGAVIERLFQMLVTLSGIVTLVRPVQPENAAAPMLVTLSGIVTLVRLVQPENAPPR